MTASRAGEPRSTAALGVATAAVSAAAFGFGTTFAKLAFDGGGNPISILLLRTIVFAVLMGVVLALLGRLRRIRRRTLLATLWIGVMFAAVSLGYQSSVVFIPVSFAALLFYSYPLLVALLAVLSGRDRLNAAKALALLTAFLGLGLVLGPGFAGLDWRGIGLALLAALSMGVALTFGGEATRDEDALLMSLYTNTWMLIALAVAVAASGGLALPVTRLGMVGAAGVCLSYVVAYIAWYLALGLVSPVRLAALFNIEPLVTLAAAWLVLGERLSTLQLAGAALVVASIVSVTLSGSTEPRSGGRSSSPS